LMCQLLISLLESRRLHHTRTSRRPSSKCSSNLRASHAQSQEFVLQKFLLFCCFFQNATDKVMLIVFSGLHLRETSRESWVMLRRIWSPLTSLVTAGMQISCYCWHKLSVLSDSYSLLMSVAAI
jgi:hypothetical protein